MEIGAIFYLFVLQVFKYVLISVIWHHGECLLENFGKLESTHSKTWLNFSENVPCKSDYNNDGKLRTICNSVDESFEFDQLPIETVSLEINCMGSELNFTMLNLYRLEIVTIDMCSNLHFDDDTFASTPEIRKLVITAAYDIADFPRFLKVISSLTKLQFLSLSKSSGFKRLQRKELALLKPTSLEELDLSSCQIEAVDRDAFDDLPKLKSLDFSSNPLSEKAVGNITASIKGSRVDKLALKHLYRIKQDLPLNSLKPLKQSSIHYLDLSDNNIPSLPSMSFGYAHLKTLNLSNSKISFISKSAFRGALLLENMDLRGNSLTSIDDQLNHVTNLRIVDISTQNPDEKKDEKFSIAENSLSNLTNLEILSVNEAPFRGNITRFMFHGLVSLEKLELRRSNIRNIDDFAFETMETLRILDLSFNSIKELSSNTFYGLENLTKLDLKWNRLTLERSTNLNSTYSSSPFTNLRSLQVLYLENNNISHLYPDILNPLTELQFLSIKYNKLKSWDVVVFSRDFAIRELLLNHNEIEIISNLMLQDFSNLRKLKILDLSDNPFDCENCSMYTFQKWAKEKNLQNPQSFGNYECTTPTEFKGAKIDSNVLLGRCEPTTASPVTSKTPKLVKKGREEDVTKMLWSLPVTIASCGLLFSFAVAVYMFHRRRRIADSLNSETSHVQNYS